jgi:hypothetical protein
MSRRGRPHGDVRKTIEALAVGEAAVLPEDVTHDRVTSIVRHYKRTRAPHVNFLTAKVAAPLGGTRLLIERVEDNLEGHELAAVRLARRRKRRIEAYMQASLHRPLEDHELDALLWVRREAA